MSTNNRLVQLEHGELTTTSLVIAEGVGVQHKNVLELIRNNMTDLEEFGLVAFQTRPRAEGQHGGGAVEYAVLNEQQTTLLLTYMRNSEVVKEFKKRLVKAFYELAQQAVKPVAGVVSRRDLALAVLAAEEELSEARAELATVSPKAAAWDHLVSSAGSWSYRDAAHALHEQKSLVIGEKRLTALLVEWGWLYRDHKKRPHAYQRALEQGLVVEKIRTYVDTVTGETLQSSAPQVRITGKGLDVIYRRLTETPTAVSA